MADCIHGIEQVTCTVCTKPKADHRYIPIRSKAFTAAYEGECSGCPEPVLRGQEVRYVGGDLFHYGCAENRF